MKPFVRKIETNYHPLPCGKCPFCVQRKVHQWSFRLIQEEKLAFSSWFITLTYEDQNIPYSELGLQTLVKKDLQDFFKRLRKRNQRKLRYYAVGEYGSKTNRPHYHIILFNAELDTIQPSWDKGHVHYGEVNEASIQYTCKYLSKTKRVVNSPTNDRQREFNLMSKGIGKNYLTPQMIQYHKNDLTERMCCTKPGGQKIAMPRYYKDKLYTQEERGNLKAHHTQLLQDQLDKFSQNPNITEWIRVKMEYNANEYKKMELSENKRL